MFYEDTHAVFLQVKISQKIIITAQNTRIWQQKWRWPRFLTLGSLSVEQIKKKKEILPANKNLFYEKHVAVRPSYNL